VAGTLKSSVRSGKNKSVKGKIGIVVSRWNEEVTEALLVSAKSLLLTQGVSEKNIIVRYVPGSYELPLAAQGLAKQSSFTGVICLGCVIQGDTPHFDYICQAVAQGIMDVNLKFNKPVIFGVLTTLNQQQALDRAGGKHGNKGAEAAATLIELLQI
jgi:6,7-dimethyl-8-ribityllumazine synthase